MGASVPLVLPASVPPVLPAADSADPAACRSTYVTPSLSAITELLHATLCDAGTLSLGDFNTVYGNTPWQSTWKR